MITAKILESGELIDIPKLDTKSLPREDPRRCSLEGSYPPIIMDDKHFLISKEDFDKLPEYSHTTPTGVYDRKCWKVWRGDIWWISCYLDDGDPKGMLTPIREAVII